MIHGDPLKLSQVMRNLLYNAINHTPEGGTITVWLKAGNILSGWRYRIPAIRSRKPTGNSSGSGTNEASTTAAGISAPVLGFLS